MIVKINGLAFHDVDNKVINTMASSGKVTGIDGTELVSLGDILDSFKDWFSEVSSKVIDSEVDSLVDFVVGAVKLILTSTISVLNKYSVDIILGGVLWCGFSCMLAPLFGGRSGDWVGRTAFVLIFGSIWRIII